MIAFFFLVPFALPFLLRWGKSRRWGLPVSVVVNPDDPRPQDICEYLAEIARKLDERAQRMRIVFDGRNRDRRAISLDLDVDGSLRVSVDGRRARCVDLRHRWIADHAVPLSLKRAVLYVEPVDSNRFRVMSAVPFKVHPMIYVICSLVATLALVRLSTEVLSASVGLAAGCYLAERIMTSFDIPK